jgi:hypothetical protein
MRDTIEIRTGRAGFGLFIGCGFGVGFLSPVYLGSIPLLGPALQSVARNISVADTQILGGLGQKVSGIARSISLPKGLQTGAGCGVALGYGVGVGMMLKPQAIDDLAYRMKSSFPKGLHQFLSRQSHVHSMDAHDEQARPESDSALNADLPRTSDGLKSADVQRLERQMKALESKLDRAIEDIEDLKDTMHGSHKALRK